MLGRCNKSVKLRMHDYGLKYVAAHTTAGHVKKSTHNDVLMYALIFQEYIRTCLASISSLLRIVFYNAFLPPVPPIWRCHWQAHVVAIPPP